MAALTVAQLTADGVVTAMVAAAAGGDNFANTGDQIFEVNNGGGVTCTVTIVTPGTVGGRAIADVAAAVPAGQRWRFGPFDPALFNDATGSVQVTYSQVATVTVQAFRAR